MATSGAAVATAMAAKARREIREHFEQADAFAPERAVAYDPPGRVHRLQFEDLAGRGIIRPTGTGTYWFDRDGEGADKERQQAAALFMLKLMLIATAIVIAVVKIRSWMHG